MAEPLIEAAGAAHEHDLSRLRDRLQLPPDIPIPHYNFEFFGYNGSQFCVAGWAFPADGLHDRVRLYVNGEFVAGCPPIERPDVAERIPLLPGATHSGFDLRADVQGIGANRTDRADIVLFQGERPIARFWSPIRTDLETFTPYPPRHLMQRVIGTDDPLDYRIFALVSFGQYVGSAAKHRDFTSIGRMLDWGCGCGRVTAHYLRIQNGPEVAGCDIDGEGVKWCQDHLSGGDFRHTRPRPPLPFPSESFDLVVSLSVMTHLTRSQQSKWLREIDRILAPEGLFLASVHGTSAAYRTLQEVVDRLNATGFNDETHDPALDGIAPTGYYRATYQRRDYTERSFGKRFEVLEYIERGVGVQDLVVAKKKARAGGVFGWMRGR